AKWNAPTKEHTNDPRLQSAIKIEKIFHKGNNPSSAILSHLESHPANLIVLATHQLGGHPFFPSVSEPVARKSHTITLFIPKGTKGFVSPEDGTLQLQKILIPIDHDPHPGLAFHALMTLLNVLDCKAATITVLYLGEKDNMPKYVSPQRNIDTWHNVAYHEEVVEGILQTEQKTGADLILMPTQGHQGFLDALRGSTTERIVRKARCPVLAVPIN
ncbi:MAG: universal stress protein, partial [Nitrospirales bacterium]